MNFAIDQTAGLRRTLRRSALTESVLAMSVPLRPPAQFERRSALYARLDAQLCDRTRFFAAAALVNTVFARLSGSWSAVHGRCSFDFLDEVGAALETYNLGCARSITLGPPGGDLDRALVCAEQRQLQHHLRVHRAQYPRQWEFIRRQLNGLLNHRYAGCLSRWCYPGEDMARVLRKVRCHVGRELDFATEAHRVRIGLMLVEQIRGGA